MTVLYFDGFSAVDQLTRDSWSVAGTASIQTSPGGGGRRGGGCASQGQAAYGMYRSLGGNHSTIIVGVAYYMTTVQSSGVMSIFGLSDGAPASGTTQMSIRLNTNRTLAIYRGATLLETTTYVLPLTTYVYLEFKVVFHGASGSYALRAGTVEIASDTGISTIQTANAYANNFHLGQAVGVGNGVGSITAFYDDLYICNGSGGVSDDFLGDCRVDSCFPTAAGTYTQFTPSAGSNWSNVDEANASAADYNYSSTVGHKDTYTLANLAALPYNEVLGVRSYINFSTDVDGSRSAAPLLISGATESEGTTQSLTVTTKYGSEFYINNPDTAAAWTQAEVNALELGAVIKV